MLTDMMNNAIGQYLVTVLTCTCAQKLSRKKRVPIVSVSHMGPRTPALHTASTSNVTCVRCINEMLNRDVIWSAQVGGGESTQACLLCTLHLRVR